MAEGADENHANQDQSATRRLKQGAPPGREPGRNPALGHPLMPLLAILKTPRNHLNSWAHRASM